MICPQTKQECGCQSLLTCTLSSRDPSRSYLDVVAPPPTLAEIERLLGEYVGWCVEANEGGLKDSFANEGADESRAALMAAIRAYGRE